MPQSSSLVGSYIGRCRVREGMESSLASAEKKRFLKANEETPLELRPDGTFLYKLTVEGTYHVAPQRITFCPTSFNGHTREEMEQAAADSGRAFGLAWLFEPFELKLVGEALVTANDRALIYTIYVKI